MSKEKQIEEMAKVMCGYYGTEKCYDCRYCCDCHIKQEANRLCNAGYRKQSEGEWISVEERLPEPKKWVLVFTRHMNHPVVCFYEDVWYFLGGFFSKGQVTHWMPLPEPPDMKGGAE